MMTGLVDADILTYRIGFAVQKDWYVLTGKYKDYDEAIDLDFKYKKDLEEWLDKNRADIIDVELTRDTRVGSFESAIYSMDSMIKTISENSGADLLEFYLTGDTNYRKEIAFTQEYKAKRPPKPVYYKQLREYLISNYGATVSENQEADDAMGIRQYQDYLNSNCHIDSCQTIICTVDKDLRMIPGWHYHIVNMDLEWIESHSADEWFWHQMIEGDSTDTIPGIPGYGKKKAAKIIAEAEGFPEIYESEVTDLYIANYGDTWKRVMNEQAQLLWIRREPNELKVVVQ